MTRRLLPLLLKIGVSGVLMLLVLRVVQPKAILEAAERLRGVTVLEVLALSFAAYLGRALRWRVLLRRMQVPVGPGTAYRLTLVGVFYGILTPGRFGEFGKALHLGASRSTTLSTVFVERVMDLLFLEAASAPAFILFPDWRGAPRLVYLGLTALTLAVVLLLVSGGLGPLLRTGIVPRRVRAAAAGIALGRLRHSRTLLLGFVGTASFYALGFSGGVVLLRDLAPGAPLAFVGVFPVIILLGNLPLAFGGIGLREQVALIAFTSLGLAPRIGPTFSLLWFALVSLVPGLLGIAGHTLAGARFRSGGRRRKVVET
jgi:uncharacterized membrane protein YbhN (UPF0104 family)